MNPKSFAWAHYEPDSGKIRQMSDGPFDVAGLCLAEVESLPEGGVDCVKHRVDLASVQQGYLLCRVRAATDAEIADYPAIMRPETPS